MRYFTFTLLFLFSLNVYAETYYCTQKSDTSIHFGNTLENTVLERKEDVLRKNKISDDIFKLDIENDKVYFSKLGVGSYPYRIIRKDDDDDRLLIYAVFPEELHLLSLVFNRDKQENKVKLIQSQTGHMESLTYRYKCSKER